MIKVLLSTSSIDLIELHSRSSRDLVLTDTGSEPHAPQFSVSLQGRATGSVPSMKRQYEWTGEQVMAAYAYDPEAALTIPAGQQTHMLSVRLAPERLLAAGAQSDGVIAALLDGISSRGREGVVRHASRNHQIDSVVRTILSCSFQGSMRSIYLEGLSLELVALISARLDQHGAPDVAEVPARHVERLHQARRILQQSQADAPSLSALSREIGLNEYALKRGFKQLFGITPFAYLHELRMQFAADILRRRSSSIAEVASLVGYVNASHFARAFRKRFGSSPHERR